MQDRHNESHRNCAMFFARALVQFSVHVHVDNTRPQLELCPEAKEYQALHDCAQMALGILSSERGQWALLEIAKERVRIEQHTAGRSQAKPPMLAEQAVIAFLTTISERFPAVIIGNMHWPPEQAYASHGRSRVTLTADGKNVDFSKGGINFRKNVSHPAKN